jgi:hypothetical protein
MFTKSGQKAGSVPASAGPPTWSTWAQSASVVAYSANLRRTVGISFVVGTTFFLMNQLPAVLAGQVTSALVLKAALTYLVPFCTSNYGILAASRRSPVGEEVSQPDREVSREVFA